MRWIWYDKKKNGIKMKSDENGTNHTKHVFNIANLCIDIKSNFKCELIK